MSRWRGALSAWTVRHAPRLRHRIRRRALANAQPDWSSVAGAPASGGAIGGARILLATSLGGMTNQVMFDGILGAALRARGASVDVLLCDAMLPACHLTSRVSEDPRSDFDGDRPWECGGCHAPAERTFRDLGFTTLRYSDGLAPEDADAARHVARSVPFADIARLVDNGIAVGEHALAGCLRFYGRGDLDEQPAAEQVLRQYLEAALRTAAVVRTLLTRQRYDRVVLHHGIYVPQGVVRDVCRQQGVATVAWDRAYRARCFFFSHGDTHHRTIGAEPETVWNRPLSTEQRTRLHDYLRSRRTGEQDWVGFQGVPSFDLARSPALRGLDARPRIALLTSVVWDARLHYPSNAFPTMMAWILATIRHLAARKDLQLVIRVHPAEVRGARPSAQRVEEQITRAMAVVPDNVRIIGPADPTSTYALAETCDAVLIYNTKAGIELAPSGVPVVVAGEAWVRGKGFTTDVSSPAEYAAAVDALPLKRRLSPDQIARAEAFAYHVFFRRMIPLELVHSPQTNGPYHHRLTAWTDVAPGRDAGLDIMCRGILDGSPFECVEGRA